MFFVRIESVDLSEAILRRSPHRPPVATGGVAWRASDGDGELCGKKGGRTITGQRDKEGMGACLCATQRQALSPAFPPHSCPPTSATAPLLPTNSQPLTLSNATRPTSNKFPHESTAGSVRLCGGCGRGGGGGRARRTVADTGRLSGGGVAGSGMVGRGGEGGAVGARGCACQAWRGPASLHCAPRSPTHASAGASVA